MAPSHVIKTDAGTTLTVLAGKGYKYRETPVPGALAKQIEIIDDIGAADSDDPVISVTTTASLQNWIKSVCEQLAEQDGDNRWRQVSFYDLRRTWATSLASRDVDPLIVCDCGGWSDLETFLNHYRRVYSSEAQQRERSKIA